MEPKGFHRKLTAILSADVAGYSRLMQDDEAATVKTLEAYKQIISDLVKQHRWPCLGANENGPTFANQNEPTRIAVILVQQPTANFI